MGNTFYFEWEVRLMEWIQSWLGPVGTAIMSVITEMGDQLVCVAVLGFLYWCWEKEYGKYVGLNVLVGITLNPMIKNIFIRRRPYFDNPGIQCLKPVKSGADIYDISAQGFSFPSGHSTNAAVMFSSFRMLRKIRVLTVLAVVAPLLVALSRVALGVHYPTDVICGLAIGYITIAVIPFLDSKIRNKRVLHIVMFMISCTGFFFCRTEDYFTCIGSLAGLYAGFEVEERFVKFENTRKPLWMFLRLVVGIALYGVLGVVLKMPFDKSFLESRTMAAFAVRSVRYFVIVFLLIGIYPMAFRLEEKKR